jgi:aspartyl-tRNA(Asn)/glutamyl-tRNA(Gln) amidotransferase subunit B
MPAERRARVATAAGLPADADGVVTVVRLDLDSFVMAAADVGADAALAVKRLANEVASDLDRARHLDPDAFCRLILMEGKGELTSAQARTVLKQVLTQGGDPVKVAKELGYEAMAADDMTAIVDQVIAEHSAEWGRFVAGEDKLDGLFLGKIKKASGGKADLKAVRELLQERRAKN